MQRNVFLGVAGLALIYAFLAGFHTLEDFDLGWQLASGRWIVQHHQIFSNDVFSYTAAGQPWIYPALSEIFFYACFLVGGYALLTWLGALASASTVAILLRKNSVAVAMLALIAVPMIASRTQPRAEMFSTILFAAYLTLLWKHYRNHRAALWLLPFLMMLWVNLHPGFISGVLLSLVYVCIEGLDCISAEKRARAIERLRRAWIWLVLTAVATILNPWGRGIYAALWRQARAQNLHNIWIVEWGGIHPSWNSFVQAIDLRDPQSSFWWLALVALACTGYALWRKQWGAAVLLAGSLILTFRHQRVQGLFACVVVIVGGSLLEDLLTTEDGQKAAPKKNPVRVRRSQFVRIYGLAAILILVAATSILRSVDLVTNRYYMRSDQLAAFGTGLSWWFPERAVQFLEREKPPGNVFNGYSLGGYLTWRLYPEYRDYIDSRALPFGPELFFRAYDLAAEPPDSEAWTHEAEARGINTILAPISRYHGMTVFPQLHNFCHSKTWTPVYMDEVSVVILRRTPATNAIVDRLQIDCDKKVFDVPTEASTGRAKIDAFNAWANAGGVLYSVERYPEALAYLNRAQQIYPDNANVHLLSALVFEQLGQAAHAETEFRTSLKLDPDDETFFDLGLFYMTQKRYADAAEIFQDSAESSARPHEMWMMQGQALLQMHQPESALAALEKAEAANPFGDSGETLGATFNSMIATGRAKACYQLGQLSQAVSFQEDAVRLAPHDPKLWLGLADLYQEQGRSEDAAKARARAGEL